MAASERNPKLKWLNHLNLCQQKFGDLEKEIKKKDENFNQLEKTIRHLQDKHQSISSGMEDLEQYPRRNCLVLYGANKSNDENTNEILIKTFFEKLDIEIEEDDLDRSHRLGKPKRKDNISRPTIVKFARILFEKKSLWIKGNWKVKRLLLTESLTSSRIQLLGEAQKKYGVTNVWTSDGRALLKENSKIFLHKS